MFFIGGGGGVGGLGGRFRGQYPRAAKNPLKTPPFFKFGSGGGFKHDIRFPRIPAPLCNSFLFTLPGLLPIHSALYCHHPPWATLSKGLRPMCCG